eukprot:s569_g6.t1
MLKLASSGLVFLPENLRLANWLHKVAWAAGFPGLSQNCPGSLRMARAGLFKEEGNQERAIDFCPDDDDLVLCALQRIETAQTVLTVWDVQVKGVSMAGMAQTFHRKDTLRQLPALRQHTGGEFAKLDRQVLCKVPALLDPPRSLN